MMFIFVRKRYFQKYLLDKGGEKMEEAGYIDESVKPKFKHTCEFKDGKCIICGKKDERRKNGKL